MGKYMSLTKAEAVKLLNAIKAGDNEGAHSEADDILIAFLFKEAPEVASAWVGAEERMGFWYA
jgi:hypothetical protein